MRTLVQAIKHLQQIVYLLAKCQSGEKLGQRVGFSRDMKDHFELSCGIPEKGSYVFPIEIGGQDALTLFYDDARIPEIDQVWEVARKFHGATKAVGSGDIELLREAAPDPDYHRPLLKAYAQALQPDRLGVSLSIEDSGCRKMIDSRTAMEGIDLMFSSLPDTMELADEDDQAPKLLCITGEVVRVKFPQRRLGIKPPMGRIVDAIYGEEFEQVVLRNRRRQIQVIGKPIGDEGNVIEVTDIVEIHEDHIETGKFEFDGDHIEIGEFEFDDDLYVADPPLRFQVKFDSEIKLYDLQGEFGIILGARSWIDLTRDLNDTLRMLWEEYAKEDPERLSGDARDLRDEIISRFRK